MVQIDFARRTVQIQLLLAGQSGTWPALRALHAGIPGPHEALRETPLGRGRKLIATLRPEGFSFRAPATPADPEPRARSGVGEMRTEFALFALRGPILEAEASASTPSPDGVLYVTEWSLEGPATPVPSGVARSRLRQSLRLRGLDPAAIPLVEYWHDAPHRPLPPSPALPFCGSGSDSRSLLGAFSVLGALVLAKLDQRYCSCMFSPERLERFKDLTLVADLSSGVTQAVLASDSRPAGSGRRAATCNVNGWARTLDYLLVSEGLRAAPEAPPALGEGDPMPSLRHPSDHLPLVTGLEWR